MARFVKGDVVVVPLPFSDLSQAKRRPALVLVELSGKEGTLPASHLVVLGHVVQEHVRSTAISGSSKTMPSQIERIDKMLSGLIIS